MKKPPFQYGDFFYYCGRNDSYMENQLSNFDNMRDDLEQFVKADVA